MQRNLRPSPRGIALIIVLSFLALISVIVLAFFSSVSSELGTSTSAANSAATEQLADSAVNLVMAQIVDGTKGEESGSTLAWTSQPGLLRTYDSAGAAKNVFKLYSSNKMVSAGSGFSSREDLPPSDWNSAAKLNLYTDLNEPGVNTTGELIFPILDPLADGVGTPSRPAVDGFKVDGFKLDSSPGYNVALPESPQNNRAPMPVKWLYVLKDGTLQIATATGSTIGIANATKTNPIVGRVAFWADDETSKVNINTASEGTYWDMPRMYSMEDCGAYASNGTTLQTPGLAVCQPAQKEYQRYPGHPATTSLSPIFGTRLPSPRC